MCSDVAGNPALQNVLGKTSARSYKAAPRQMLAVNAPELVRSASHADKEAESLAKAHEAKGGETAEPVRIYSSPALNHVLTRASINRIPSRHRSRGPSASLPSSGSSRKSWQLSSSAANVQRPRIKPLLKSGVRG